ncbi:ABC transporter ATP-binding protein [bacterium]|nr:ABC transporter ATP-binding protein [bacterium]
MTGEENAVTAVDLSRRFGQFTAVDRVTFSVPRGEVFGFLGANGAGKTTTIRMLCGLLRPSSGSASVSGLDVYTRFEEIKTTIGYMSQQFSLYDDLTVEENLHFYGGIYGVGRTRLPAVTGALLDQMTLGGQRRRLTRDLPLGWKQRLALAAAIIHDPGIVFLDEPTSGVDPASRREFWLLIHQLAARGKTIFVTTHYMDEAEYCHRVSIMKEGRIAEIGNPSRLKEKYRAGTMQQVFINVVKREQS